jgi:hypothetical protein
MESDEMRRLEMKTTALNAPTFEELDYRDNDGLEISLLWNPKNNTLSLFVVDTKTDDIFEIAVQPEQARDAFIHPFPYIEKASEVLAL